VLRLGRLLCVKGPGLFFLIPFIDSMVKVDLRIVAVDVPEPTRL
jgi:regulator of protease activity HflC (stomatin/prohibitin superfamily)